MRLKRFGVFCLTMAMCFSLIPEAVFADLIPVSELVVIETVDFNDDQNTAIETDDLYDDQETTTETDDFFNDETEEENVIQEEVETEAFDVDMEMIPETETEYIIEEVPDTELSDDIQQNGIEELISETEEIIEEETTDEEIVQEGADEDVLLYDGEYTSGSWKYIIEGGTATVTGYTGSSSSIVIPDSLGGYTVTSIEDFAFENSTMTSLTIPRNISYIGEGAFQYCSKLSTINFNARNCAIDFYYWSEGSNYSPFRKAGASASSLTVNFGSTVEVIPENIFRNTDAEYAHITKLTISNSVTTIGENAFFNCKDLSSITWGSGIQKIADSAFENAQSLKSLTIPAKVISIGEYAFSNSGIMSLTIPEKVTSIGRGAFQYCSKLSTINFNARNCAIDCYYWNENSNYGPFRKAGASVSSMTVNFGSTVEVIPENIFRNSSEDYARVTKVIISNSVTEIQGSAFENCKDLSSITWGSKIQQIGDSAFTNTTSLTDVNLPSNVMSIGSYAFSSSGITKLTIPEKVTSIGMGAFQYCYKMTSINFNARKCSVDCYYWNENSNYSPFRKAGASASSLTVNFGSNVELIPENIFMNSSDDFVHVTKVVIPNSVKTIEADAFNNCKQLSSVTVGLNVKNVGDNAFKNCSKLTIKCYPDSVVDVYARENGIKVSYIMFAKPGLPVVKNGIGGMKVSWKAVPGAKKYRVYCRFGSNDWLKVADTTDTTWFATFSDKVNKTPLQSGRKYWFTIRCMTRDGKKYTSDYNREGKANTYIATPGLPKVQNNIKGMKVSWKAVPGAQKYRVYCRTGKADWLKVADTTGTSWLAEFSDKVNKTPLKSGQKYWFSIRCLTKDGKKYTSYYNREGKANVYIATPGLPKLKNTDKGIKVSWKKVNGAAKYRVYCRYGSGDWMKVADTTKTSWLAEFTDKFSKNPLKKGTRYYFSVRCLTKDGKKYTSDYNRTGRDIVYR